MNQLTLAERIVQVDGSLSGIPHAFGGALALAYYAEPRATADIDLNVFVPTTEYVHIAARLCALGIAADTPRLFELVDRDGQVRVMWDEVPIDIFLSYDAFHDAASLGRRTVPFAGQEIDVLSPEHLMVCKVVFNRAKDWVDLDAMLAAGTVVDAAEVLRWVARMTGDEDSRYSRVVALLTRR